VARRGGGDFACRGRGAAYRPGMRCVLPLLWRFHSTLWLSAGERSFAPAIYPFQNGTDSRPADDVARLARELGYQGIGSVTPQRLAGFNAACDAEGI
jgi:hypothetical protein